MNRRWCEKYLYVVCNASFSTWKQFLGVVKGNITFLWDNSDYFVDKSECSEKLSSKANKISKGVMVLINNNFDQEVTMVRDPNGNFLILEISIQKQKNILVNMYGPNEDKPQFYKNRKQKIDNNCYTMWGLEFSN